MVPSLILYDDPFFFATCFGSPVPSHIGFRNGANSEIVDRDDHMVFISGSFKDHLLQLNVNDGSQKDRCDTNYCVAI